MKYLTLSLVLILSQFINSLGYNDQKTNTNFTGNINLENSLTSIEENMLSSVVDSCGFENVIAEIKKFERIGLGPVWMDVVLDFEYSGTAEFYEVLHTLTSTSYTYSIDDIPASFSVSLGNETTLPDPLLIISPVDDSDCSIPVTGRYCDPTIIGNFLGVSEPTECELRSNVWAVVDCSNENEELVYIDWIADENFSSNVNIDVEISKDSVLYYYGPMKDDDGNYLVSFPYDYDNSKTDAIVFDVFYNGCECGNSSIEVIPQSNCTDNSNCSLENLNVEIIECTSAETADITIDFIAKIVSSNYFEIYLNGELFSTHHYAELPLTISDFPIDINPLEIVVKDEQSDACELSYIIEPLGCENECIITGFDFQVTPLTDDCEGVSVKTDIEHYSTEGFNINLLKYNNDYSVSRENVLPPFDSIDVFNYMLVTFTEINDPCCRKIFAFNIGHPKCAIFNFTATEISGFDCDEIIDLDYETVMEGKDSFFVDLKLNSDVFWMWNGTNVYMNETLIDKLDFPEDDSVRLGPFVADGVTDYELKITETCEEEGTCFKTINIGRVDPKVCMLSNLNLEYSCEDEMNRLEINFETENVDSAEYVLFIDGAVFGEYLVSDLPQVIDLLNEAENLLIQIKDDEGCQIEAELEMEDCTGTVLNEFPPNIKIAQSENSLQVLNATELEQVELFDFTGKKVFYKKVNSFEESNITIPLNNIVAGIYILRINSNQTFYSKKTIVY